MGDAEEPLGRLIDRLIVERHGRACSRFRAYGRPAGSLQFPAHSRRASAGPQPPARMWVSDEVPVRRRPGVARASLAAFATIVAALSVGEPAKSPAAPVTRAAKECSTRKGC